MFTQLTLGVHVKDSEDYSLLSNGSILFKKKKKKKLRPHLCPLQSKHITIIIIFFYLN